MAYLMEEYQEELSGKQILVAEDNPANQMAMKKLLKKVGVVPEFAGNGKIALEMYQASGQNWDLILMDCEMPVMDGYDATAAIRLYEQEAGLARTLIIGLSAHAINELKDKAMERGMDDYLTKPIDRELLYQTLVSYLA